MKEYLNRAMDENRTGTSQRVKWFADYFPRAAELIVKTLGAKPFHIRGPLNTSVLDSTLCTIIDNLDKAPADLQQRYGELVKDEEFKKATFYGTSDVNVLHSRFEVAHRYLIS